MARRRHQNPTPIKEGGWWYLRLWQDEFVGGKVVRKLKRIKLAEADTKFRRVQKLAEDIVRPINQSMITVGSGVDFASFVTNTYEPLALPNRAASVRRTYKGIIKTKLKPAFEKSTLADLTPLTVQGFFSSMAERGDSLPCIMKTRDALSSILRFALKKKFIFTNPMEGLELPRAKRGKRAKPFIYPHEFQALVELMPEPYATMVYTAVWTGLRVSELLALKWADIGSSHITIDERYCRGEWAEPKTDTSAAPVCADSTVLARIHRLKTLTVDVRAGRAVRHHKVVKSSEPDDLVFQSLTDSKKPMNDGNILRRFIKPAADKLGLHVNWRCLRTSCATWMVQAGADPKSVQGQMRHARITTTMEIYAQFVPEGQRRAVELMSEYAKKSIADSGTNAGIVLVQ